MDLHPVVIPAGADQLPLLPVGEEGVLVLLLVEVLGGPALLILLVVLLVGALRRTARWLHRRADLDLPTTLVSSHRSFSA